MLNRICGGRTIIQWSIDQSETCVDNSAARCSVQLIIDGNTCCACTDCSSTVVWSLILSDDVVTTEWRDTRNDPITDTSHRTTVVLWLMITRRRKRLTRCSLVKSRFRINFLPAVIINRHYIYTPLFVKWQQSKSVNKWEITNNDNNNNNKIIQFPNVHFITSMSLSSSSRH